MVAERFRNFVFTSFKDTDRWENFIEDAYRGNPGCGDGMFIGKIKYICAQLECCPTTGKYHIQGYCELVDQMRLAGIKKVFRDKALHVEKRQGTQEQAIAYCSKEDTRVCPRRIELGEKCSPGKRSDLEGIYDMIKEGTTIADIIERYPSSYMRYKNGIESAYNKVTAAKSEKEYKMLYKDKELRPWQEETVQELLSQNEREILWVYDKAGNTGKTWLCNWLEVNKEAFVTDHGRKQDITYRYNYENIICFDLTRHMIDKINYSMIESFKSGKIQSDKYECVVKRTINPKIIVMANSLPDFDKWSKDRYKIGKLINCSIRFVLIDDFMNEINEDIDQYDLY